MVAGSGPHNERNRMDLYKYTSIREWAKSQNTTRTAAELADSGIPVFPCNDLKRPMTDHGFKDASTDPTRIAFFFRDPGALIAMPTGLASNIDVIDEDTDHGGDLSTLGTLPMKVVAKTRSGGRHVFFKHRDGIRNTTGLRPGIDVRGEGGYVVLWAHSDVGQWISGDLTQPLPEYPDHLDKRRGTTLRGTGVDLTTTAFKHGERNSNLFRGLCSMRELNRPLDEALEWAQKVAEESGYDATEAEDIAQRVYETYEPGDFPDPEPRKLAGQNFHHTDMGNADRFEHLYGDDFLYVHKWRTFVVWSGQRWERDERGLMGRLAEKTVRAIYREAGDTDDMAERSLLAKHAKSSEAQHKIKGFLEILKNRKTAKPDDFDTHPMLFNCANGTLDLSTGALRDHDRRDLITCLADVEYHADAEAPIFDRFMGEILPSEPVRGFVQRLMGYALNGKTNEKALPICHGPGDGGKSTLLNTVNAMCGDYGLQASNDLLTGRSSHPTEVADLYGRRFVTNIETEEGRRLKESLVKTLTGGDKISARRMHENPWNFWPSHTLFMATNHRPEIKGTDSAIWNRVKIVPFTYPVPKHKQDRELSDKLRTELPGILAWAVRGHMEWLQHGLQEPDEVKAATQSYRLDMDVLARFLDEECETGAGCKVSPSLLYGRYLQWCEESGEQASTKRAFGGSLQDRGFEQGKSGSSRYYKGLGIRNGTSGTEETAFSHESSLVRRDGFLLSHLSQTGESGSQPSTTTSEAKRGVVLRCPDCETRTRHVEGTCTACGRGD